MVGKGAPMNTDTYFMADGYLQADLSVCVVPIRLAQDGYVVEVGNLLPDIDVTVSTAKGSNALIVHGLHPLSYHLHVGHILKLSPLGANHWQAPILAVRNIGDDQIVHLDSPGCLETASRAAGITMSVGLRLSVKDVGKVIHFGSAVPGMGFTTSTISTVVSENTVRLQERSKLQLQQYEQTPIQFAMGTDNYPMLSDCLDRAFAAGYRRILQNSHILATKIPRTIGRFFLNGAGHIFNTSGEVDTQPRAFLQRSVIPLNTSAPEPPERGLSGAVLFSKLKSMRNLGVVFVGASTFSEDPGSVGAQTGPVRVICAAFQKANPMITFKFRNFSIGGRGITQFAHLSEDAVVTPWRSDSMRPWVGNADVPGAVFDEKPSVVVLEWSGNDIAFYDTIKKFIHLNALLETWPEPPATLWVVSPYHSLTSAGMDHSRFTDSASRFVESYCRVTGKGILNFRRELTKKRDGFDPNIDRMMANQPPTLGDWGNICVAPNGGVLAWACGRVFYGPALEFWRAAGYVVSATCGGAADMKMDCHGCFHVGYDPDGIFPGGRPDELYIQVDIGPDLPGAGLPGASCPTVMGHYSISAGSNRLSYRPAYSGPLNIFLPIDDGTIFTVPNCGSPSSSVSIPPHVRNCPRSPWFISQAGPMVAYAKFVDGCNIDLYVDEDCTQPAFAITTISPDTVQFVLRGSPRIYPGIADIAADVSHQTHLRMWSHDDRVGMIWQSNESKAFSSIAVKGGMPYPLIFLANGTPDSGLSSKFRIRTHGVEGLPDFALGERTLCQPDELDEALLGPAWGSAAVTPGGGSGQNHPSTGMNKIWRRVIGATDLTIS